MSDHYHYEYAEARHDHRGDYADSRHDHYSDYAEKHHRHYDEESLIAGLREDLGRAEERIRELEDSMHDALERVRQLEDRRDDEDQAGEDDRSYTHPDVFTAGVEQGWAEAEADPARVDWAGRLARAAIPFEVAGGRPVNPCEKTAVRYGRNEMGYWGENLMADALVTITYCGFRCLLMIERGDGYGWAVPGGHVEPGETGLDAAVRELAEETGLTGGTAIICEMPPRYVPDPRSSDEAWAVTIPVHIDLGDCAALPAVNGGDDARRAEWVSAASYEGVVYYLDRFHGGRVFAAHEAMLREFLGAGEVDKDQDDERRPLAELIRAAAGQSCSYCQASPGVPCDPPAGYHAARFLGLLASRAESETVADAATGSGGLVTRIVREVTAVANGQDDDRAECGCPKVPGQIRHQRGTCTDPVVARLNWHANDGEAGQP